MIDVCIYLESYGRYRDMNQGIWWEYENILYLIIREAELNSRGWNKMDEKRKNGY